MFRNSPFRFTPNNNLSGREYINILIERKARKTAAQNGHHSIHNGIIETPILLPLILALQKMQAANLLCRTNVRAGARL